MGLSENDQADRYIFSVFCGNVADTSRALAQAPAHSTTSMDTSGQHLYGPLFIIAMYPFKVTYRLFSKIYLLLNSFKMGSIF